MVKKVLKKGKDNIFYIYLRYISKIYNKKIVIIVDNINGNLIKICFYKSYISTKIKKNLSTKLISKITTKLDKIHINFCKFFSNILLKRNCYI